MLKWKMLSAFLVSAMLFSFTACGSTKEPAASEPAVQKSTDAETVSEPDTSDTGNGEITRLVMAFPYWTGAPADTQKVQDAINDITREKLNIEVELQISDAGSYKQNITLALSGSEQLDIVSSILANYTSLATQGYLTDLNENDLLNTYGQDIINAVGQDKIDACYVNGTLYGLPNNRDIAQGRGCMAVATEYLEAIGYKTPEGSGEIIRITQEEMDRLLAKIHEAFPDIETYRPAVSQLSQYMDIDILGGSVFGVLLNYGAEAKVENLFTSDAYMEYCKKMYEYNQKGYISKDAATDSTAVSELRNNHRLVSYTTAGKPGIKFQESSGGVPVTIFQTKEDFMASNVIAAFPWAIPITTVDASASVRLLNELYTNPKLANLLIYGIEGTHYTLNEQGLLCYPGGKEGSTGYTSLQFLAPNEYICYVPEGNSPDLWEQMKEFNDNAKRSVACGFTFDATNVANELAAVQNVYDEYQRSIEFGFVDPETAIPEMNKKMMDAGLEKIIQEKQNQLDSWMSGRS